MTQTNKITAVAIYVCDDCGIMDCAPGRCMECDKDMTLTDFLRSPAPAAPVCSHDPRTLAGQPIGMYHCPECGEMVVAGMAHPDYSLLEQPTPAATVTFNQKLKRITDAACVCPKCKWSGKVFDCEPDVDGDGGLGCPKCNTVVVCEGDAPAAVTGWRPEWGILEVGEVMLESDEWWDDRDYTWNPLIDVAGITLKDDMVVRRRLTPPALTDAMRALVEAVDRAMPFLADGTLLKSDQTDSGTAYAELRSAVAAVREGSR